MKILYIASDTCWGGANVALFNLIKFELNEDLSPVVLVPKKNGPLCDRLRELGVPTIYLKFTLSIYPSKNNHLLMWLVKLGYYIAINSIAQVRFQSILSKVKPDIVHTNVGPLNIAQKVCNRKHIPHVWHIREFGDQIGLDFFPSKKQLKTAMFRNGNYNIAITKGIFSYYKMRENTDCVVYDGVFDANQAVFSDQEKNKNILVVGRIEPNKQTHVAINAFIEFQKHFPDYKLLLIGSKDADSIYFDLCSSIVKKNHAEKSITFCGERSDVNELMKTSSMVIVPSLFEGFGFVTAEAMFNRCIVVGRNTTGTKEQLNNGHDMFGSEIGFRFEKERELVDCMIKAVTLDTRNMIESAQKTALHYYSAQKHSTSVLNLYKKILN